MVWRNRTDIKDRIIGTLVYLFAIYEVIGFGTLLFALFPPLALIAIPLIPIGAIYSLFGAIVGQWSGFIVFLILFLAVAKNERISHFIRYNTMQTILIGILLSLISLIIRPLPTSQLIAILLSAIFVVTLGVCIYAMVQCVRGLYAEIPIVSKAAYEQVYY